MTLARIRPWWPALIVAALGLTTLYADAIQTRFLNDDYLFLEEAQNRSLVESLQDLGPLGNYYRPLSRQVYFEVLAPLAGDNPLVFHIANYVLFLLAVVLVVDLLWVCVPAGAAVAAGLFFALMPMQHVNLTWVSCSQDLLALVGCLGAFALERRGRTGAALLAYAAAVASKESALPFAAALVAWHVWVAGSTWREALRRAAPFFAVALVWAAIALWMRSLHAAASPLQFDLSHVAANYVHLGQSLLGLEHPPGMLGSLLRNGPAIVPLLLIAAAPWLRMRLAKGGDPAPPTPRPPRLASFKFAAAWVVCLGIAPAPVAYGWSAYYYTLAAVGGALMVGLVLTRIDRWGWAALTAGLLWWHAGSTGVRAFGVAEQPWVWTSHLTHFYFQRAASLADTMSVQLTSLEPAPGADTRFFFATLPPWAGFQMGNGALIRNLYDDPSLESFFYSRFSDSTAAAHPVRFVYWDGRSLQHLYERVRDPFFQVGGDLLLLDRPAGAAHAFRRGLANGEDPRDHLYWLGWAELMAGNRPAAEAAWARFGASDDSLAWALYLRAAATRLDEGDSLGAKRDLARAVEVGIGRPEAHAVLGNLLMSERPKYATMELKVASFLKPDDWLARRDLILGLAYARLDDGAAKEIERLKPLYPEWSTDSTIVEIDRRIRRRSLGGTRVAQF